MVVGEPLVAIPAALASHFVCDALPHFGFDISTKVKMKSALFRNYLFVEAIICALIVLVLVAYHPQHWLLAAVCAFVAASPDLISANRYFKIRHDHPWRPNLYSKFAKNIQWFEKPSGAVVEIAWCAAAILILIPFLR